MSEWTNRAPTAPGYYWLWRENARAVEPVRVYFGKASNLGKLLWRYIGGGIVVMRQIDHFWWMPAAPPSPPQPAPGPAQEKTKT